MKVICKNCGKRFDFDTYMGLCPKCSTYYREGKEYENLSKPSVSSAQERNARTDGKETSARAASKKDRVTGNRVDSRKNLDSGKGTTSKRKRHGKGYYIVTALLLIGIVAAFFVTEGMIRIENLSGKARMELEQLMPSEEDARHKHSVRKPIVYSMEEGEYQIRIVSARRDKDVALSPPDGYEWVVVSYQVQASEDIPESSWLADPDSGNPAYYGIHTKAYLTTKTGEYLEPEATYEISKRKGWEYEEEIARGLSQDFRYGTGILYFLVKEGDADGMRVNCLEYENAEGDHIRDAMILRESFQLTGLKVKD